MRSPFHFFRRYSSEFFPTPGSRDVSCSTPFHQLSLSDLSDSSLLVLMISPPGWMSIASDPSSSPVFSRSLRGCLPLGRWSLSQFPQKGAVRAWRLEQVLNLSRFCRAQPEFEVLPYAFPGKQILGNGGDHYFPRAGCVGRTSSFCFTG